MYKFDKLVEEAVVSANVEYTRYADDLTFSAPRTGYLNSVTKSVASVIRQLPYPKLELNAEKTTCVTPKYHRLVTGLTLANDGRVTIGRDRKRKLHAAVHRAATCWPQTEELQRLCGMLAIVKSVEPAFIRVLERRYGRETVERIHAAGSIRPELSVGQPSRGLKS